jgi:hypothetical protein
MRVRYFLYSAISFGALHAYASDCLAPTICKDLHRGYEEAHEHPKNHVQFKKFVRLLSAAVESKCEIPGVKAKVPAYRVCFDAGFTVKANEKGEQIVDKRFKGPEDESFVLEWYAFADKSKFPEGRQLTRSKAFRATTDGGWAEMFNGD